MDICVWHPSAAPLLLPKLREAFPRHIATRLGVLVPAGVLARRLLGCSLSLMIYKGVRLL